MWGSEETVEKWSENVCLYPGEASGMDVGGFRWLVALDARDDPPADAFDKCRLFVACCGQ